MQSVLNSSILPRPDIRATLTVFTGHAADNPLLSIRSGEKRNDSVQSITEIPAGQLLNIQQLKDSLDNMHLRFHAAASTKRKKKVQRHNAKTNIRPINFEVGDYVLLEMLER